MRWVVFLSDPSRFSLKDLRFSLKLNPDLADNVSIKESQGRIRLYGDGYYEEYEIKQIVEVENETYYIAGRLLKVKKPDYKTAVKNFVGV